MDFDIFDFEYLIVSNADVEIEFFNEIEGDYNEPRLIGPIIKNLNQKYQNPYLLAIALALFIVSSSK